jgi:centrosomal protein CEP104
MKQAIDRFKSIGMHITQLHERKRLASMNEDYDAAKIIKVEIDKLK